EKYEWDDCKNARAEIVFIIDGSRSIHPTAFKEQITFLKSFVDHFEIGKNGMRFGAVTFGDKIIKDNTFGLTQYASKDQLKNGISNIDFKPDDGDSTETYLAIKYAHGIIFKDARPDIKKIAIVITDGQSTAPNKTAEQAMKMRKEGILIFAIGVGKDASKKELLTITGRNDYVFMVDKYSLLKTVRTELRKLTCNSDKGCRGMVDINFVFDSSVWVTKIHTILLPSLRSQSQTSILITKKSCLV
ncbi:collagen alpha-4(VI) chain-like, partial [Octopus sinensis]|uniref:Collagen alpha-4(VI) chain-like n=1 Tax=Octopus sinensis TaxID=2607531 RepID=A0A6P7TW72_9MOLL